MAAAFFSVDQLRSAGPLAKDEPWHGGWWVDMPGISYVGRAVAPVEWDAEQVADALNRLATRLGHHVVQSRLYSRLVLDEV